MISRAKLLEELESVCARLNIQLRYEKTSARGGLCKVDGRYIVIVDRKAKEDYKATVIAKALKQFDLSDIHLKPSVREFIDEV
jgi:2,3-bisphosphoglycerate-independent phosphoglycerate mutase